MFSSRRHVHPANLRGLTAPPEQVPSVSDLELAAFDAWPAEEVEALDGWRLRAMAGVTRRANSAWTAETRGARSLDERIASVEAFYAKRGLASQFMLSPLSPPELDLELEARGYRIDSPVVIQIANASQIATLEPSLPVRIEPRPSAAFLEALVERGRFRDVSRHFHGLLRRLDGRANYAVVTLEGGVAGAAFGVLAGDVYGVFGMLTLPEFRRRGVASAIALGLSREAVARGARFVYLQVERDNVAALALYAELGFRDVYGYHYRVAEARDGSP